MMWRHGDMATSIRHGSFDERGGVAKCRHVAMSPCRRDSVLLWAVSVRLRLRRRYCQY